MYTPYVDLIGMEQADVGGDLNLIRHAWLSRLAHDKLILKHMLTGRLVVSCGSSLSDVCWCWEVEEVKHGLYEPKLGDRSKPVLP